MLFGGPHSRLVHKWQVPNLSFFCLVKPVFTLKNRFKVLNVRHLELQNLANDVMGGPLFTGSQRSLFNIRLLIFKNIRLFATCIFLCVVTKKKVSRWNVTKKKVSRWKWDWESNTHYFLVLYRQYSLQQQQILVTHEGGLSKMRAANNRKWLTVPIKSLEQAELFKGWRLVVNQFICQPSQHR